MYISGICSVQYFLTTSWLITMAEWKPINGIQTKINIDEQELDNHTFKKSIAQWLDYNTKNKKQHLNAFFMEGLDGWVGGWVG